MRIFIKQQNIFETDPVTDEITGAILDSLDIKINIFDKDNVLVTGSNLTVGYVSAGVYRVTIPVLTTLVNKTDYQIEVIVKSGSVTVWYFLGNITAIIKSTLE